MSKATELARALRAERDANTGRCLILKDGKTYKLYTDAAAMLEEMGKELDRIRGQGLADETAKEAAE